MRKLFGTDGVRGIANVHPMTVELAVQLGRAIAHLSKKGKNRHRILIGKDTRLSCYMLENALSAGICSMGVEAILVGPLPTPGIAFLTQNMRASAGVVISASHNPFQDNGIKFFAGDGFKLPDAIEMQLEEMIFAKAIDQIRPTATEVGKAYRIEDAVGRYIVFLKAIFPKDLTLDGIKIVVDCANGAAYKVAPAVFEELGAEVITIGNKPNGTNINDGCGSLHPELMCRTVREQGATLGIALDGDADRVIIADEHGEVVDGDHIMAICARNMIKRGTLHGNTLVATVMSNLGLERSVQEVGGRVIRTQVGDRYVVEEMRKSGYCFGGEQSGHLIFLEHTSTGDGVVAALQLLAVMLQEGKPLSELARVMTPYPQALVNVQVARKVPLDELPSVRQLITQIEGQLKGDGRVLVRYSGTEAKARVMVEGPDAHLTEEYAHSIADELTRAITPV